MKVNLSRAKRVGPLVMPACVCKYVDERATASGRGAGAGGSELETSR